MSPLVLVAVSLLGVVSAELYSSSVLQDPKWPLVPKSRYHEMEDVLRGGLPYGPLREPQIRFDFVIKAEEKEVRGNPKKDSTMNWIVFRSPDEGVCTVLIYNRHDGARWTVNGPSCF